MVAVIRGGIIWMNEVVLVISLCLVVLSIGNILYRNHRERKLLTHLSEMLEKAIAGAYEETDYDESLMSSVEAKMARFLSSSKLSYKHVELEKNEIKSLISDISHQTKTPIANIRLFSELLLEMELSPKARHSAEEVNRQAEKLQFLIDVLVKMSRMENGIITVNPSPQSVEPLIEKACHEILPKAKSKEITIITESIKDVNAVYDLKWTLEALINIIDNSVKYTPKGGEIRISGIPYEMFCRIDITDNGMGIPETEQPKIFQRFYRSHQVSQSEGIGVGLYLAREIIAREGGYIQVKSEIGKGSTFSVFLPRK